MPERFEIWFRKEIKNHLKYIDKKYWNLVQENINEQLTYEPNIETVNRKPLLNPKIENRWEIRFGERNQFRVFYEISEHELKVEIIAIGLKKKDRLYIAGKEIK